MQILRVDLENVKSYERATVEFALGVNTIMGHNGAGKSTILEAIGFALFDTLPYSAAEFLREGAKSGRVAVTFIGNQDERPYRVERRLGSSSQYVVYDVELQAKLCEGKADVLAFVRRQAGADSGVKLNELFENAIGVQQGALTAAFLMTPAHRKPMFDSLLQVDDYKTASDKLLAPRNVLQERTQAVAQAAAVLAARLERLPQLQAAVKQRAAELVEGERAIATLSRRLEQITARKAEWDAVRRQIEESEQRRVRQAQQCAVLEAQVAEAQRQLAEAEGAASEVAANQEGHDRYLAAQGRKEEVDRQLRTRQDLRDQHARADKQLALAQADLARSEERLAAVAAAEALIGSLASAVARQTELEIQLGELQKERGSLQEAVRSRTTYQDELQKLRTRADQVAAQLVKAEQVQQAIKQVEQSLADLRGRISQQTGDQGKLEHAANELKRQTEALKAVETALCPVCEQPLSDDHRRRMLARNEERLQEMRKEFAANKKRKEQDEAALQAAETEQKQHNTTLRSLPRPDELEDVRGRIVQLAAAVEAGGAAQTRLAAVEKEYSATNAELAALQNPRQQSAVAQQQTAERPHLIAAQAKAAAQKQAALDQLAELDAGLRPLAGLDDLLAEVNAALRQSQAAYQTVLANRKLAASVPQRAIAIEQARAALAAGQATLAELAQAVEAVKAQFDEAAYTAIAAEDQTLRSELGGQQARQTLMQREQARDEAELHVLQGQQEEFASLEQKRQKLNEQSTVLDAVRTLLRQSGPFVTQALIRQISAGASRIFGELMQDYSRELQWQDDYGVAIKVDSGLRQFSQLSGGEQMSAALAVRLALVREVSNIDIAFFDEPTANLDEVRRQALAQQIMNVRGFRQLFVISHDDTFEQMTQNVVRVQRDPGGSRVVSGEGVTG